MYGEKKVVLINSECIMLDLYAVRFTYKLNAIVLQIIMPMPCFKNKVKKIEPVNCLKAVVKKLTCMIDMRIDFLYLTTFFLFAANCFVPKRVNVSIRQR